MFKSAGNFQFERLLHRSQHLDFLLKTTSFHCRRVAPQPAWRNPLRGRRNQSFDRRNARPCRSPPALYPAQNRRLASARWRAAFRPCRFGKQHLHLQIAASNEGRKLKSLACQYSRFLGTLPCLQPNATVLGRAVKCEMASV